MALRAAVAVLFWCWTSWDAHAKVYERCELARELRDVHEISESQLATWVCIAKHESLFDTAAHNPGSGDHGIFQISELYWCSPPGNGYACGLPCSALKDDDIEDDVICAKRIYRQHKRISGDGFTAWVVYNLYCRDEAHVASFLAGCFDDENLVKYSYEPEYNNTIPFYTNFSTSAPTTSIPPTKKPTTRKLPPLSTSTQKSTLPFSAYTTTIRSRTKSSTLRSSPKPQRKFPSPPTTPKSRISTYRPFLNRLSSTSSSSFKPKSSKVQTKQYSHSTYKSVLKQISTTRSFSTPTKPPPAAKKSVTLKSRDVSHPDDRVYAVVDKPGYSFSLRANGFKFTRTAK